MYSPILYFFLTYFNVERGELIIGWLLGSVAMEVLQKLTNTLTQLSSVGRILSGTDAGHVITK